MGSRFNVLLHGSANDAADLLSGDYQSPHIDTQILELRAALTNALSRVYMIEVALAELQDKSEAQPVVETIDT